MSTKIRLAGAAVLALAAFLLVLRPWQGEGTTTLTASTATYAVRLSVDRPRSGANTFDIEVEGRNGGTTPDQVSLEPVMPQMGHAYPPVTASPLGAGRFRAAGAVLPMPGMWRITVTVSGTNGTEQAVFPLVVK
ncbi:hypothetical protein GCM10009733_080280 [Nonomuraea maheshkhaliensis]|uniref:YtkA-like domain-containing protein n=1 Tax=Nonomuraea maheshkhaliensis TaxID=419590 RepID=A0ABN2GI29_9ACTN